MAKKLNLITMGLLLILGLRLMVHIEPILVSQSFGVITAFLLYLVPFIGVILRRRWGPAMSGVVGILDLAMTLSYVRGSNMIGSAVADGALIFLSYLDYRQITTQKTGEIVSPTQDK